MSKQTPVMSAALGGHVPMVELLIELKADVDIPEKGGLSALHGAALYGHAAVIDVLGKHSRAMYVFDDKGYEPIHRASLGKEERHTEAVSALLKLGVPPTRKTEAGQTLLEIAERESTKDVIAQALKDHEFKQALKGEL